MIYLLLVTIHGRVTEHNTIKEAEGEGRDLVKLA